MTNADIDEEIAKIVRSLQLYVKAWMAAARDGRTETEIHRLDQAVLGEVTRGEFDADAQKHVSQFRQALDAATDDTRLIQTLYEEVQFRTQIPMD